MDILEKQADVFKALSHPVRLKILNLLCQKGELCVCDIFPLIGLEQSTASRHLTMLRKAKLVSYRKEAQRVLYRVDAPEVAQLLSLSIHIGNQ